VDILKLAKEDSKKISPTKPRSELNELCPNCRQNGRVYCPHKPLLAIKAANAQKFDKTEFFGPSPPNLFVGHFSYPQITWGPTVGLAENVPDNPKDWYGWDFDKIVYARSMQIRGQVSSSVHIAKSPGFARAPSLSRIVLDSQESAMSINPVDLETHFSKKPTLNVSFHQINQPTGPSAPLLKMRVADNPKIPSKVDELVSEGVRANAAMAELLFEGFDEHYLTRLLTAGVLGQKDARRFVPTKWGITAVDDTIAKEHMKKIREMPQINEFMLFSNEYLANRFFILLLPGAWEYENFESWCGANSSATSCEYEGYFGRSDYAQKQGGGYYAARLSVCEALATKIKKQARVVLIREIMPEYDLPVGVWEIRENVRHAFLNNGQKFSNQQELMSELSKKLKLPLSTYICKSSVLRQRKLTDY